MCEHHNVIEPDRPDRAAELQVERGPSRLARRSRELHTDLGAVPAELGRRQDFPYI